MTRSRLGRTHLPLRLSLLLMAAVTVPILQANPVLALCTGDGDQVNIAGYSRDSGFLSRGTKSSFLSPAADADCGIIRSIWVYPSGANDDFAEVGSKEHWAANLPHPFVAWNGDAGYNDGTPATRSTRTHCMAGESRMATGTTTGLVSLRERCFIRPERCPSTEVVQLRTWSRTLPTILGTPTSTNSGGAPGFSAEAGTASTWPVSVTTTPPPISTSSGRTTTTP
jgi:hypothetical protein